MGSCFAEDERVTNAMESIFPNLFTFSEGWVEGVGVYMTREGSVEYGIKVGNIGRIGEFVEGYSDEVQSWCVVPAQN